MAKPIIRLWYTVLAPNPANAEPLLAAPEVAYSSWLKPCAPGLLTARRAGQAGSDGAKHQHTQRHHQQRGHQQLHLTGLQLLAQVLRRTTNHQPGQEHGDQHEQQHAVQPCADTPKSPHRPSC